MLFAAIVGGCCRPRNCVCCVSGCVMASVSNIAEIRARKSQGQDFPDKDKIVPRKFGAVAKLLWPVKTANELAFIAKTDERTAKRWLRGEHEPPLSVVLAVIHEMLREQTELNLR